jgi:uncharacterized protein YraI
VYRCVSIVTLVMMIVGGLAVMPSAARAASTQTIDDLNLRAEPALNAEILDVMPAGSSVEVTGDPENGFYPVSYGGLTGYAYGDYLSIGGTGDGAVTTGGQMGEVNVVDGPVNFRTGPSEADDVISVIPDGALVALTGDSFNGFFSIIYTDRSGWAHGDFIFGTNGNAGDDGAPVEEPAAPEEPVETDEPPVDESVPDSVPVGDVVTGSATVVDGALNLRSGPGTGYTVITVLPDGASVELRGDAQGNFQPLSADGTTGWASLDFLAIDGDEPAAPDVPAPTEEPAPPAEEPAAPPSGDDDIVSIIYAAADAYGQPREDMLRVATCESNLVPTAVNPSSQASGLFQFLPSTWETTPYADQDIFDPVANANAAAWMWDNGRRNEWVCQ